MKIPLVDLTSQHKEIMQEMERSIKTVIRRGDFILGKEEKLFAHEFASFCNCRYAIGVSSGTAALFLALLSLGIGKNDEVIVPAFTYIATALAVSYTGAKPIFVDIEEDTYNIDPQKISKAITKRTKAIIPVHLYGQPAHMQKILSIAKTHNLKIIEDAAQAHGAEARIKNNSWAKTGSMGDLGCFSFYPSKNMGALGDGGMITTNNEALYRKLLMLRDYGRTSRYEHTLIGYNSRLDTLQAAVLRIKLKKINQWNKMRRQAARNYRKYLRQIKGIVIPYESSDAKHVYHVYAIRALKRDALYQSLLDHHIGTVIHYPIPLHLQKAYKNLGYQKGDFPVSEKIALEIISLPMYPHLTETQIRYIAKIIKETKGQ